MVKEQLITDQYAIYNSDCIFVMSGLPEKSIDLSIYSPPFAGLYNYSSSELDHSNCESKEQFLEQYEFVVKEISRLTKPGRITAVHVTNIKDSKSGDMWNLPAEIIKLHQKHGFGWKDQITIWKEPLKVRMRTMVRSLMHKLIVEDSTECFTAMPDYVLVFKRDGQNEIPVTHPFGLTHYAGAMPLLIDHLDKYGLPLSELSQFDSISDSFRNYFEASFKRLKLKYKDHEDPKTKKLSHIIWQRYASSVWDDIRIDEVLKYKESKDEDDEKHVHPLQLDVIDRCVELWSNPGEVVLTPYMGVGSEVFSPVSMGRKGIGIELKDSYFKQAIKNLKDVAKRFDSEKEPSLFNELELIEEVN